MKALTCLLLMVSTTAAFAQHKFALALQIAPIYAHSDYKARFGGPPSQSPATEVASVGNGLIYSVGLSARYAFSSKWSIATGLWATHAAISEATIVQDGVAYNFRYQYNHPFTNAYKAPLLLNYQSSTNRLSPYFSLGVTFDFRAPAYVDLDGTGQHYIAITVGKPVVISPLVGIGLVDQLTDHWSLLLQPTLQYDLQARPGYDYSHFYQLSLQTQLMYKF